MRTGLMAKKLGMTRVFDQNRKTQQCYCFGDTFCKSFKIEKNR